MSLAPVGKSRAWPQGRLCLFGGVSLLLPQAERLCSKFFSGCPQRRGCVALTHAVMRQERGCTTDGNPHVRTSGPLAWCLSDLPSAPEALKLADESPLDAALIDVNLAMALPAVPMARVPSPASAPAPSAALVVSRPAPRSPWKKMPCCVAF